MTALLEDRGVAEPIQSYYEAPVFRRQVDWTPAGRRARIPDCCGPTETRTFGTSFRMARGREELHAAMRLVHDSYVRLGFIRPNRHGLHVIPYHVLPTTDVLVAVRRGEVVATASVVMDSPHGLPLECVFQEEVEAFRLRGFRIAEVSCLADKRDNDSGNASCLFRLMALVAQRSGRAGVNLHMIVVHPRHARFYEHFLGFIKIGKEKPYEKVAGSPAVLLAGEIERLPEYNPRAYQRLCGESFPDESYDFEFLAEDVAIELNEICDETYPGGSFLPQPVPMCA